MCVGFSTVSCRGLLARVSSFAPPNLLMSVEWVGTRCQVHLCMYAPPCACLLFCVALLVVHPSTGAHDVLWLLLQWLLCALIVVRGAALFTCWVPICCCEGGPLFPVGPCAHCRLLAAHCAHITATSGVASAVCMTAAGFPCVDSGATGLLLPHAASLRVGGWVGTVELSWISHPFFWRATVVPLLISWSRE